MLLMLENFRDLIWGIPCAILLAVAGIYVIIQTRFFSLPHVNSTQKRRNGAGMLSQLRAISTALGGTVGIGSIIGVAYALKEGGPGSLFWMWVCALFGMAVKYAEVSLAVRYRAGTNGSVNGGAPYIFELCGKPTAARIFALICIISSVGTGCVTQSNAVSSLALQQKFPLLPTALVFTALTAFIIFGGKRMISATDAVLIPAGSLIYILMCIFILTSCSDRLPQTLHTVFNNAFSLRAATGGVGGSVMLCAMRVGFSKGVYSNEAGMGTSPFAHASSSSAQPHRQGVWGMFEVFFDTFIVSTLTALALLCSGHGDVGSMFRSFFGTGGELLLTAMTAVFAFAAMLSWCFYAECCLGFLHAGTLNRWMYRLAFVAAVFIGCLVPAEPVWIISDLLNAAMLFPNTLLLFSSSDNILKNYKGVANEQHVTNTRAA